MLTESRKNATEVQKSPRKRTRLELDSLNLTSEERKVVRRKLLVGNIVISQIGKARQETKAKRRSVIHRMLSSKLLKKYRMLKAVCDETGISRNRLGNEVRNNRKCAVFEMRTEIRTGTTKKYAPMIKEFFEREDNCRRLPGKKDCEKEKETNVKEQLCVLTDYMSNLYTKFQSEYTDAEISFASFCRMRPRHVKLCSFLKRSTCLCSRHQNMAEKTEALRKLGMKIPKNPERLSDTEFLEKIPNHEIAYKEWRRENKNGRMKTESRS